MNESNQLYTHNELDSGSYAVINKGKVDLVVLKYMAQRVRTMLRLLDTSVSMAVPLLHIVPERHGRMHRMVFYELDVACFARIVIFVGFVSKKQASACGLGRVVAPA